MSKPQDIRTRSFTSNDKILLDANIWIFLHGPQGNPSDHRTRIYSRALANMISAKCQIVVDALVVSEFINTCARLEFNLVKQPNETFKQFRQSAAFKPIASDIAIEVRSILGIANRIECDFSTLNDTDLLNEFAGGDSDFNDLIIEEICRNKRYTLVTHDSDFRTSKVPILTANGKLLSV